MEDQHLSIHPVCHSPQANAGNGRPSPRPRQTSFSYPARSAMERADYWGELDVKTGMKCAFGIPDPAGDWDEVLEEEKPEEWSSVCLHFTQNTTFHGINKITESTPFPIRRVIWVLIVLGGLSLFMIQMVGSVLLYLEYPVTVNTRIVYNKTVTFPAVTICNQNVFRISQASRQGHYSLIDAMYNGGNATEGKITMKQLFDETAHDKADMIESCQWDGKSCSADDFVSTVTHHGVCFTFNNVKDEVRMAAQTGSDRGLRLRLNIEQYEYMAGPNSAAGAKILVHDLAEMPLVRDFGQAVSPGSHAFVGIQMSQMNNLMHPHGECRRDMSLEFFNDYNIPNCRVDCLANYLRAKCNCRLAEMPEFEKYPGEPRYCTLSDGKHCVADAVVQFELAQSTDQSPKCDCPMPCTRRKYDTSISYGTTSNYDTVRQGRDSDNEAIQMRFVNARETTQRVDVHIAAADGIMVRDLRDAASNIDGIFDQIKEKMYNVSVFIDDVFTKLNHRTFFHRTYGLLAVQKALQYGFVQPWNIDRQHLFNPLCSGQKQLLIRYRKAMLRLVNVTSGSPRVFREMVAWTQEEQLSSRLDIAQRTRDAFKHLYTSMLAGKPILGYGWAIHPRYKLSTVPVVLLRRNKSYLTSLYEYIMGQLGDNITIIKALKYMVRHALHKREWNETYFHELRSEYLESVKLMTYGHNTFTTEIFDKMEQLMAARLTTFDKLTDTARRERGDIGIAIQNFNELVRAMKEDVWPVIMGIVQRSADYIDDKLNKTALATAVTSQSMDARLKEMANIFIDVRARMRNFDHDWRKFQDAQAAVWTSMKREDATRSLYAQIHADFRRAFRWPSKSAKLLEPFMEKLNESDPGILYRRANADLEETGEEAHLAETRSKFENFKEDLAILSGINENDDRFFDVFNRWKTSLVKFVEDCKIDDKFFKENFLEIDVYMTELYYQIVEQREAYDLTNLWSDIGGSMGLFVGASVITVFELIDAMLHNFLKVQLQETKQRRRSMAVSRAQSMREASGHQKSDQSDGGKPETGPRVEREQPG